MFNFFKKKSPPPEPVTQITIKNGEISFDGNSSDLIKIIYQFKDQHFMESVLAKQLQRTFSPEQIIQLAGFFAQFSSRPQSGPVVHSSATLSVFFGGKKL